MPSDPNSSNFSVILAGGSGTRLWPLSRTMYPKQFLRLTNESSLLQNTLLRATASCGVQQIVVCNEEHRFLTAEQMRECDQKGTIILEPAARNTAPAIALAALHALQINESAVLTVLAADHVVNDLNKFTEHVNQAIKLAEDGALVTYGIVPEHPETGYGYIKAELKGTVSRIERYEEKPDAATALK